MLDNSKVWLLLVTWTLLVCLIYAPSVLSQNNSTEWSAPIAIVETDGKVASTPMALVGDSWGRLHLLFPHSPNDTIATGIDYISWDGDRWSIPVNVLINLDGSSTQNVRAVIDGDDRIHAIWNGGANKLYYSSASTDDANSAHGWLAPIVIAKTLPTEAGIAVAPDGNIWVAYADADLKGDIDFVVISEQTGTRDYQGSAVHDRTDRLPGEISLVIDNKGHIYLTWTTFETPEGWPPTAVHNARSLDLGNTWEARIVAKGDYGQSGVVVPMSDQVHIFWNSTIGGDGTYHQWSSDGGRTWSSPERFIERGGFSGLPSLAVDSTGGVHYLKGDSLYTMWNGIQFSAIQGVSDSACPRAQDQAKISCGERAQLALTTGNRLHVIFETDFNQLWYISRELDTPMIPTPNVPQPQQELAVAEEGIPKEMQSSTMDETLLAEQNQINPLDHSQDTRSINQVEILGLSIMVPFLLVFGIVVFVIMRKSRR